MREENFWGYRRPNGRVGVRNHVVVLSVDDISNAACENTRVGRRRTSQAFSSWRVRISVRGMFRPER